MIGKEFGRLMAIELAPKQKIKCRCRCGNTIVVSRSNLKNGHTKSCGCIVLEKMLTHGKSDTRIYSVWAHMKSRCSNPNDSGYKRYGGRGISVCPEWSSFNKFYRDMKEGYSDALTIDRIDNNGNYCKANCKWSSKEQQSRNTRRNVWLTANGETQILADWAKEIKIGASSISRRLNCGQNMQEIYNHFTK